MGSGYRDAAYRWLGAELGEDDLHIGKMDEKTALYVAEVCEGMGPEVLQEWVNEEHAYDERVFEPAPRSVFDVDDS